MFVSTAMLVAFANCSPYLRSVDDTLAQSCQMSLSLALAVGLLGKSGGTLSSISFSWMLIACVTFNLALGGFSICFEFLKVILPKQMRYVVNHRDRSMRKVTWWARSFALFHPSTWFSFNSKRSSSRVRSIKVQDVPPKHELEIIEEDFDIKETEDTISSTVISPLSESSTSITVESSGTPPSH
jgi:hypothetical protein